LKLIRTILVSRIAQLCLYTFLVFGVSPLAKAQVCVTPGETPIVVYQHELLTIRGNGCALSEVLSTVGTLTGISFEIPVSAKEEFVFGRLGPDRIVPVLASLFRGIRFNYLIAGSDRDPSNVHVVLSETSGRSGLGQGLDTHSAAASTSSSVTESTELSADTRNVESGDASEIESFTAVQSLAAGAEPRSVPVAENAEAAPNPRTRSSTHREEGPRYFPPVKTQ
jgi:hypothetical protein